jgi:hypothetical protein
MRVMIVLFALNLCIYTSSAQQKFSPEKYQADVEEFITKEADLNKNEAAAFFPLLREMQEKQRAIFKQLRTEGTSKPADENAYKKAIQKRDQMELELKNIQQTYHNKFLGVLPASKAYKAILAEDRFNRRMFRNWGMGRPKGHRPQKANSEKK